MNMVVFKDWLIKQNNKFKKQKRKILLLVDNAAGHNISTDLKKLLTNIQLEYLSPNTTSHIQLADAGIISSFKGYCLNQVRVRVSLSRFEFKRDCTTHEYLIHLDSIESAEDTSEPLSDEIIYLIVSDKLNKTDELNLPEEFEVPEEIILLSEAKKSYSNLFKYFEQKNYLITDTFKNFMALEEIMTVKFVQSKLNFN